MTRGDWQSPTGCFEEKWSAWGLLLAVIVLNLGNVYVSVRINEWNNVFYNALQKLDGDEFFRQQHAPQFPRPRSLGPFEGLHEPRIYFVQSFERNTLFGGFECGKLIAIVGFYPLSAAR